MTELRLLELKDSFCDLLRSVNRPHTEEVISELERIGFFESPASRHDHLSHEGGLLEHSMNVYHIATLLANDMRLFRNDLPLSKKSIIVASLCHDICKTGRYHCNVKGEYEKDYSSFPSGHGEASVIWLLQQGYYLEDQELLAIRWHMGPWHVVANDEMQNLYKQACLNYPLVPLIHTADTLAAQIVEVKTSKPE
jgi:hypothetical protein